MLEGRYEGGHFVKIGIDLIDSHNESDSSFLKLVEYIVHPCAPTGFGIFSVIPR